MGQRIAAALGPLRVFHLVGADPSTNAGRRNDRREQLQDVGRVNCARSGDAVDRPLVWRTISRRPGPARVLGPSFGRSSGSGGNFAAGGKLEDGVCSRLCEFGSTYTMPTDALDTTGAKFHAFREMTFSGVDGPRRRRLLGPLRTRSLRCRRSHGLQVDVRDTPRRRRPAALAVEPPRRRHAPRTRRRRHGASMGRKRPWNGRFRVARGLFCRSWRS